MDVICQEKRSKNASCVPSWLTNWPDTVVKKNQGGMNVFPLALCMRLTGSGCHLVNCYLPYAARRLQTTTFIPGSQLNRACTCNPYVQCGLLRMDGTSRGVLFTSLHDLFKNQRADAPAGWLNDGWCPQPMCLPPMTRHRSHWGLPQSNIHLKFCPVWSPCGGRALAAPLRTNGSYCVDPSVCQRWFLRHWGLMHSIYFLFVEEQLKQSISFDCETI